MSNKEILSEVLTRWSRPMLKEVLGARLKQNETFGVIENTVRKWFPVSASYSLMGDIDFAVNAIAGAKVKTAICGMVDTLGIDDASIPEMARDLVKGWSEKCEANGGMVTLFENIVLERSDIEELCRYVTDSFK